MLHLGHEVSVDSQDYQISLPQLDTSNQTNLLQQWLHDCDTAHVGCRRDEESPPLPTRLLAIGTASSQHIKLLNSIDLHAEPADTCQYAALSYRWGDPKLHIPYQTTVETLSDHMRCINLEDLPLLLQHAIKVTRDIGMRYIWVDSLCIVQDDDDDWEKEADLMDSVFRAAFCVIAATRATGVREGFLQERAPRLSFQLQGSPVFVAEDIENFQRDVLEGHLNKRAWVLQERALARRTIYFTETQIYWECGDGIRCETLTKLRKYG